MTTLEVIWDGVGAPGDGQVLVGQAHITRNRRQISTTFYYDPVYLASDSASIDPSLPLVTGAQHQRSLVRAFADSAPDRWGRGLIEKAERARAREQSSVPRRLDDLDFLLGVSDDTRQGALRYRIAGEADFLGPPSHVPKLVSLPELLDAADALASDANPSAAVKQLLDTGTTGLGGARPKASVRLEDGSLAIAKFPHSGDGWDVMAWEATALDLLERAGIRTPRRRLTRVGERSVLLLRRFDRTPEQRRIGYISAMTMLGADDGDHRDYADIADAIRDHSLSPAVDHHELFDRVVVSVGIGNTDDHLRNHGFLAGQGGWRLAPAYDVNPTPDPWRERSTTIMGADSVADEADALPALGEECSLSSGQARERIGRISAVLSTWRDIARSNGISEHEITLMAEGIEPRREALGRA